MPTYKILICEFPYGNMSHYDVSRYVTDLCEHLSYKDKRFGSGNVFRWHVADTPITMGRNRALLVAERNDIDFVVMIDSDMSPDMYGEENTSKRFWSSSIEFMLQHNGPCAVVAPYCGPPPNENVYVFQFENFQSDCPSNTNFNLRQYTRFEAAKMAGIQPVASGPTGLCILDMRGIKLLRHPRFYYEWKDATHSSKDSTEDVTFFRDLNYAGCPVYCNWDAWAGHYKTKLVGKPDFCETKNVINRLADGLVFDAAKKFGVPEQAVKLQLESMCIRPDESNTK